MAVIAISDYKKYVEEGNIILPLKNHFFKMTVSEPCKIPMQLCCKDTLFCSDLLTELLKEKKQCPDASFF